MKHIICKLVGPVLMVVNVAATIDIIATLQAGTEGQAVLIWLMGLLMGLFGGAILGFEWSGYLNKV